MGSAPWVSEWENDDDMYYIDSIAQKTIISVAIMELTTTLSVQASGNIGTSKISPLYGEEYSA
jgi:hypothetical protein